MDERPFRDARSVEKTSGNYMDERPFRDARSVEKTSGNYMDERPFRDARSVEKRTAESMVPSRTGRKKIVLYRFFTDLLCLTAQLNGSKE